jgi:hypothetical protein
MQNSMLSQCVMNELTVIFPGGFGYKTFRGSFSEIRKINERGSILEVILLNKGRFYIMTYHVGEYAYCDKHHNLYLEHMERDDILADLIHIHVGSIFTVLELQEATGYIAYFMSECDGDDTVLLVNEYKLAKNFCNARSE